MVDFSAITSAAGSPATENAANSLAGNFEMFLTLLTEQMQNQDPLNPLDSNEFVSQLVQFSSVEQQINQNRNLESLLTLQSAAAQSTSVSYIGRQATVETDQSELSDGEAQWSYVLPREAADVSLVIRDSRGAIVDRAEGATNAGEQSFTWDGMGLSGGASPDGLYTLEVYATDANGDPIAASTRASGRVTGVDLSGPEVVIQMGGLSVPLSAVRSLREIASDPNV